MEDTSQPRRNTQPIRVWVTPQEKAAIAEMASTTGNSTSAYLRKVGLGYEVRSILDFGRAQELVKVNADLGRLGGLLKLWLAGDKRLEGYSQIELRRLVLMLLVKVETNQQEMREILKKVAFS
ncbi:MAG: conjugal transfer protein TraJ [Acetobacteraceae bacterium]|nr:MAG: conjugal transfer protein TraJ [Acetobacteraceae bacterium]